MAANRPIGIVVPSTSTNNPIVDSTRIVIEDDQESSHYSYKMSRYREFDKSYQQDEGYAKLIVSFLFFAFGMLLNAAVQSVVHDDARDMDVLPDRFFFWPEMPMAEKIMNWVVFVVMLGAALTCIFHQYRFLIIRRLLAIAATLYICRAITMFATPLPPSYDMDYRDQVCAPSVHNATFITYWHRFLEKVISMGQGTAGVCGDMLFSGHTLIATISVLTVHRYTPRKFGIVPINVLMTTLMWVLLITTVILLILAHAHYTIDIIFGYWMAIGLFIIYHLFTSTKHQNRVKSEAKMLVVTYLYEWLEKDTPHGPVPNAYNFPVPMCEHISDWLHRSTSDQRFVERLASSDPDMAHTQHTTLEPDATTPLQEGLSSQRTHKRHASSPANPGQQEAYRDNESYRQSP